MKKKYKNKDKEGKTYVVEKTRKERKELDDKWVLDELEEHERSKVRQEGIR